MNPLDLLLVAAGIVGFVFSFFNYYKASVKDDIDGAALCRAAAPAAQRSACSSTQVQQQIVSQIKSMPNQSDSEGAWHGFFGWFGALLLLIAALIVAVRLFAPSVQLRFPVRLSVLGLAALGLVSTIIALFVIPKGNVDAPGKVVDLLADFGHGFGYWIVLVLSVVFVVVAALRFLQTKDEPGRAAPGGPPPGSYPPPAPGPARQ